MTTDDEWSEVARGRAINFADRTRANLDYIIRLADTESGVHPVTQVACSLLGLIVFPREEGFDEEIRQRKLSDLQGWPQWEQLSGSCDTLGGLVDNLRHAVAHGHMRYSSDSRSLDEVMIEVENPPKKWRARTSAKSLAVFCTRFIDLLSNTIG